MAQVRVVDSQPSAGISIWKNRNFLMLFLSGAMISLSGKVYELTLPLIIYEFSKSSVAMGTMRAVEYLPNLLLAMVIGVIIDRVNKKRFMQGAILIQVLFLFVLFALLKAQVIALPIFYVVGFVFMLCNYGFGNSRNSIVKMGIPKELLTTVNAKFSLTDTFFSIMGPAISGLILMLSSLYDGLLIIVIALFVGLLFISNINSPEISSTPERKTKTSFGADLKEGWQALRSNHLLLSLSIIVLFNNAADGMFSAMVIFFAKDSIHLTDSLLGAILSTGGVGALIGSLLVPRLRAKFSTGKLMGVSMIFNAIGYATMYFATNMFMMGGSLFLEGFFMTVFSICVWTFRQETTPVHLMGRVSGLTGSIFKIGLPFSIFGAGWVAATLPTTYVFMGSAILVILVFLVYTRLALWKK